MFDFTPLSNSDNTLARIFWVIQKLSEERKGGIWAKIWRNTVKCAQMCREKNKMGRVKNYRLRRNSRTFLQDPGELPEAQCEVDFNQKSLKFFVHNMLIHRYLIFVVECCDVKIIFFRLTIHSLNDHRHVCAAWTLSKVSHLFKRPYSKTISFW